MAAFALVGTTGAMSKFTNTMQDLRSKILGAKLGRKRN